MVQMLCIICYITHIIEDNGKSIYFLFLYMTQLLTYVLLHWLYCS